MAVIRRVREIGNSHRRRELRRVMKLPPRVAKCGGEGRANGCRERCHVHTRQKRSNADAVPVFVALTNGSWPSYLPPERQRLSVMLATGKLVHVHMVTVVSAPDGHGIVAREQIHVGHPAEQARQEQAAGGRAFFA